jgi:hypothetical protein
MTACAVPPRRGRAHERQLEFTRQFFRIIFGVGLNIARARGR